MSEETGQFVGDHEKQETKSDRADAQSVDPRDLVQKGGSTKNPTEIVQNPAVSPPMINEPGGLRDDLRSDD